MEFGMPERPVLSCLCPLTIGSRTIVSRFLWRVVAQWSQYAESKSTYRRLQRQMPHDIMCILFVSTLLNLSLSSSLLSLSLFLSLRVKQKRTRLFATFREEVRLKWKVGFNRIQSPSRAKATREAIGYKYAFFSFILRETLNTTRGEAWWQKADKKLRKRNKFIRPIRNVALCRDGCTARFSLTNAYRARGKCREKQRRPCACLLRHHFWWGEVEISAYHFLFPG